MCTKGQSRQKSAKCGRLTRNSWGFLRDLPPTRKWLIDSGTSDHVCGIRDWFIEYQKLQPPLKVTTVASHVYSQGIGTVRVQAYIDGKWRPLILQGVLHVPGSWNILAELQFLKKLKALHPDWYLRREYDQAWYLNNTTRECGPTAVRNDRRFVHAQFMLFREPRDSTPKALRTRVKGQNEGLKWTPRAILNVSQRVSDHRTYGLALVILILIFAVNPMWLLFCVIAKIVTL